MTVCLYVGFVLLVLGFLALDLGVFHRKPRVMRIREALAWSSFWIALSLAFNVAVYYLYESDWGHAALAHTPSLDGKDAALQFFTAYLVEWSLSLDNIFVFTVIFSYFRVPAMHQHRVLFWGIVGALVMRGVMIAAGASLLAHFDWMAYVFGAILIFTAVKLLADRHEELEPERNPLVRFVRRHMAVTDRYDGDRLLVRVNGRWAATPLLLVLLVIEVTDVLFAVDSIPAVFAITTDPFLVVTSNACAVLGLRSLYFALAPLVGRFRFIKISLVFILAFVGVKMFLVHHYPIPTVFSLAVIAGILFVGFTASVVAPEGQMMPIVSPLAGQNGTVSLVTVGAARRVVALVIGTSVVLLGIALIVLPGPAFVVIPAGLAILASEFVWAQRLLSRLKRAEAALLRSAGLRD